ACLADRVYVRYVLPQASEEGEKRSGNGKNVVLTVMRRTSGLYYGTRPRTRAAIRAAVMLG
ncbi:MAG: hypothetical protein JXA69_09650, partial [Phycisphaerae bacterium]|nr:hypothetical protein [Phycisphaerae bacterium]